MVAKEHAIDILSLLSNWRSKFMKMGDLSGNEVMLLRAILMRHEAGEKDFTMSELADTVDTTKSAASQLIGKLEEKGLVERYMTRGDRRVVCVRMTDGGNSTYGMYNQSIDKMFDRFISLMGEEDTETMVRLVKKSDQVFSQMMKERLAEKKA